MQLPRARNLLQVARGGSCSVEKKKPAHAQRRAGFFALPERKAPDFQSEASARGITSATYDRKLQELKDKQHRLNIELEEFTKADHEYHIHVNIVLNLCRYMGEIFESSKPSQKRAMLNLLLQNPTVRGRKLEFALRKPFTSVLELAGCPNWLRTLNEIRTFFRENPNAEF